jgi:hypothetical protein
MPQSTIELSLAGAVTVIALALIVNLFWGGPSRKPPNPKDWR